MSEVFSPNVDESSWIIDTSHVKREFIAGGTAGSIGIFIGFPMDLIKVNLQAYPERYRSAWHCFTAHVKEDVRSLYRGCLMPILTQGKFLNYSAMLGLALLISLLFLGLINSLLFVGESSTMKILEPNLKPGETGKPLNIILAGSAGGILQCVALVPSDVIKCTMQAQEMSSSFNKAESSQSIWSRTCHTVRTVYRQEGIGGFYKGLGITAAREAPSIGLYFFSYKLSRDLITRVQGLETPSTLAILTAGGLAGAVSWASVYPIDVIKTNMQITHMDGTTNPYQNLSIGQVGRSLYAQYGMKVFFRGLGTTVVRAFPVNAATFFFYERIKATFHLD